MKIDLCCGNRKPEGFFGVDSYMNDGVDIIADLNNRFPFDDNSISHVRAYDAIEHLINPIFTMNEIWRVSKADGYVEICVPSTDGKGAFQDPTHRSFWNINSFLYYTSPVWIDLARQYGFIGRFEIIDLYNISRLDGIIYTTALLKVIK